jgi:hypothetical protein
VVRIAAAWSLLTATIALLLLLAVPTQLVAPTMLISASILLAPLTRIAATPLALDWNRHR